MTRLAVMAHYDPRGALAPHVRRQVEALAGAVDDLVVVSTADLTQASRSFLRAHARLVERDNVGYDFLSYRAGLDLHDLGAYDEVTVCNDSYVGPLTAYSDIFAAMAPRESDFWGLSETDRVKHHVQSFFVTFRPPVLASAAFREFWADTEVLPDRSAVIRRYEVGMSRRLYRAGFASAAYFVENGDDRHLARRRVRWWALRRTGFPAGPADVALLRRRSAVPWNPSIALADRALQGARLPHVKIDTLRYDPYGLGAERLLDLCEERFPAAFEGVRGYLADTAQAYPPRAAEVLHPVPLPARPLRRFVEYHRAR
ncbi:MAG: rhamnan synthesis F family protein [Nocardioides sp.]|nr:rhamnan synthesis F family protein [Nocardioides sp.]